MTTALHRVIHPLILTKKIIKLEWQSKTKRRWKALRIKGIRRVRAGRNRSKMLWNRMLARCKSIPGWHWRRNSLKHFNWSLMERRMVMRADRGWGIRSIKRIELIRKCWGIKRKFKANSLWRWLHSNQMEEQSLLRAQQLPNQQTGSTTGHLNSTMPKTDLKPHPAGPTKTTIHQNSMQK